MTISDEQIACASSISEVRKLVADCQRCPLYSTKTTDVVGVGSETAEVMFIGEAPGKNEDKQGEPFVGAAGKLLNELLEGIGMSRAEIYIANVLKHRPPNNRDPLPTEAEACFPFLARQIELINPKLIVFLGRHAMNRYFPDFKISEVHGNDFRAEKWGRKQVFLALYHPAAALYNGSMKETLAYDFKKIPKILDKITNNELQINEN